MSNNTPDYENNLAFEPVQTDLEDHIAKIGSQDELPTQGRKSDVLIQAIEKCEKLEKQLKIAVDCLKKYANEDLWSNYEEEGVVYFDCIFKSLGYDFAQKALKKIDRS